MAKLEQTTAEVQTDINEGLLNQPKANPVYTDLRFQVTRVRVGALNKPDFDYTNIGLLFPQNDVSEIIYGVNQFPHSYKLGTDIEPHIHFIQSSAAIPVFKLSYRWYNNGDVPPAFTTITSTDLVFTYPGSGSILQILEFPMIDGSSINGVSSILDIKLWRDDNVVTGDVLVKEIDFHYQVDQIGSRQEYIK